MRTRRLILGLSLIGSTLLAGCEPVTIDPGPSPAASTAGPAPSSKPTPEPTPLPAPVFSSTPEGYKNISGWTGSLKVSIDHSHSAPNYSYQESYTADGLVRIFDTSTQGAFFRWPLPSTTDGWQTDVTAGSELNDSQDAANPVHQTCHYSGKQITDVGLSLSGGSYRIMGNLSAVTASCEGSPNQRQLPGLAIVENRRYFEFSYPLPATGTDLKGSYSFVLDGKNLNFSWDLKPVF